MLVRVHAVNVLSDLLGVGDGERARSIEKAMQAIAAEGRGVIVLIRDLGPNSVSEWIEQPRQASARKRRAREIAARSKSASGRKFCATSASTK